MANVNDRNRPFQRAARVFSALSGNTGLIVAASLMIALGIWLRVQGLGFPPHFTFDEHHFVENARPYLTGGVDRNDHPPLGKLLIATALHWFGDKPTSWRFFPLCFGFVTIALAGAMAERLFRDWRAGLIAAAFVAVDGFFISYSRAALLDGMLTCFVLASALAAVTARSFGGVLLASALVGLAASIKFSGITMVGAIVVFTLVLGRAPRLSVLAIGTVLVVYFAQFSLGLALMHRPYGVEDVWKATFDLTRHHLALTDMTNPATSHWYTWFFPIRPLMHAWEPIPGGARVMSSMGNPLLWWSVSAAVLWALSSAADAALVRLRKLPQNATGFFAEHRFAILSLLMLWALPVLPWIISRRDSYIYHYLPAYGFGLVLVAGSLFHLYKKHVAGGLLALLLIAEVSVFYAPIWGKHPLTHRAIEQRLVLKSWGR
jgi:dolichyl-phosphate-mannose-protein mannosyltransferase